jgi:hypothetical protein
MSAEALSVTGYYLFREEGKSRKRTLFCTRRRRVSGALRARRSMQGDPGEVAA